ncbi:hypothetical protein OAM03_01260 [Verrucomicrobia bacterium]|nr:hypothetical protein [Verrucomicrobiota bacterium]
MNIKLPTKNWHFNPTTRINGSVNIHSPAKSRRDAWRQINE